jgi:DNA-directed RNA polymerase subunit H
MEYGVDRSKLPKIKKTDPASPEGAKVGDVIKITRNSATAGTALYYRVVVE